MKRQSKIEPTKESLDSVDIDLIRDEDASLLLHHRGCGTIYRVSKIKSNEGALGWFNCPDERHEPHRFGDG